MDEGEGRTSVRSHPAWARLVDSPCGVTDGVHNHLCADARAITIGKRAFHAQRVLSLADAYVHASQVMADNLSDPDASEGIGAFLAKRPPRWQ